MNDRIKIVRKHYHLNQTEFGARLGVKQTTVAGWENSSRSLSDPIISLICREFCIDEHWLRTGEGNMTREEDQDNAMMQWVGSVLSEEPTSIRRRFLYLMKHMTPADWARAEQYAHFLLGDPINPTDTQE